MKVFATDGLHSPWNSPGQNTGVGSPSLLQGIFPTQGSNPGLLHCRRILYQLSHQESPRTLEWVAYPFSSGSSWPRYWTRFSWITGRFFTKWATREVLYVLNIYNCYVLIIPQQIWKITKNICPLKFFSEDWLMVKFCSFWWPEIKWPSLMKWVLLHRHF